VRCRTVGVLLTAIRAPFDLIRVAVTIAVLLTLVMLAVVGEAHRQIAAISPPGRATGAALRDPDLEPLELANVPPVVVSVRLHAD
jgi:hypothetical protein